MSQSLVASLQHALVRIATNAPRVLVSPPTQPRRASVALILRVRPTAEDEPWLRGKWRNGEVLEEDLHLFPSALTTQDVNGGMSVEARLRQFFALPWVQRGTAELLFIKRAVRENDHWSAHMAFPGGRRDEEDESGLYTAMRETWEEVGIDLAESDYLSIGHLEDREITSSLGKRLLMILSPYVFLQLSPFSQTPNLQPSEVASLHWVPLALLYTPTPVWGMIYVDIARHAPRNSVVRGLLRKLIGKMTFRCIELPNKPAAIAEELSADGTYTHVDGALLSKREDVPDHVSDADDVTRVLTTSEQEYLAQWTPRLQLWGLTLGMTLDFLAHMSAHQRTRDASARSSMVDKIVRHALSSTLLGTPSSSKTHNKAPSVVEVFPRFSYPDVNFWIWVFGWRYRTILNAWEGSIGTEMEYRAHWSGLALAAF
ncbi:hypothetical protein MSPP1_003480 [Malassezia sp. CBS 17886]|nr:hypothetical protein MSPP1_003480 [Malassezia sp. CBS 17886]